uniref:Small ribosomal subunit protein uS17 n=1 Tax=Hirondellea gigas TaxID=1518452 RepID=A0A6A7GA02_9CRUS
MDNIAQLKSFPRPYRTTLTTKELIKSGAAPARYSKNIGIGFATPDAAKTGTYVDKKCPWTSNVSIRGKILKGIVISTKMTRTIVVRRNYLHFVSKYRRFEKRHSNISVHLSPAMDVTDGDIVTIGECRPLSKTVRFNVIKVQKNHVFGNPRKIFKLF